MAQLDWRLSRTRSGRARPTLLSGERTAYSERPQSHQLNEPGPSGKGMPEGEDDRSGSKRNQGQCNGTRPAVVTRGQSVAVPAPSFNFNQPFEEERYVAYL